jgi:hypothetical protein
MKEVELTEPFLAHVRAEPKETRHEIGAAINAVATLFGRPHLHTGAGVRQLAGGLYECRAGLQVRLLFRDGEDGKLYFFKVTDHNGVRDYLKNTRPKCKKRR